MGIQITYGKEHFWGGTYPGPVVTYRRIENVPAHCMRHTNAFASTMGHVLAMWPLAKLLWTFVLFSSSCVGIRELRWPSHDTICQRIEYKLAVLTFKIRRSSPQRTSPATSHRVKFQFTSSSFLRHAFTAQTCHQNSICWPCFLLYCSYSLEFA